jgi:hypothetical protein
MAPVALICKSEETKPLRDFLAKVGDKWSILVVVTLARAPKHRARFSELQKVVDGISQECYEDDRRKLYHAVTFADHATQYFDLYGDLSARKYLETSAKWLRDEARLSPWSRAVARLQREVDRRLR